MAGFSQTIRGSVPGIALVLLGVRLLACSSSDKAQPTRAAGAGGAGGQSSVGGAAGGVAGGGSSNEGGKSGTASSPAGGAPAGGSPAGGDGGCGGQASAKPPAPICSPSSPTIKYATLDGCGQPVFHEHMCPGSCAFASATSARCVSQTVGEVPFRTCTEAADCGETGYCVDASSLKQLVMATCQEGVCDWQTGATKTCTFGCVPGLAEGCRPNSGAAGSTSGSFPSSKKGVCDNETLVSFYNSGGGGAGSGSVRTTCANGCVETANGAACLPALDERPAYSCSTAKDCPSQVARCVGSSPDTKVTYAEPICPDGLCTWATKQTTACAAGSTCTGEPCPMGPLSTRVRPSGRSSPGRAA